MGQALTSKSIEAIKPPQSGRTEIKDDTAVGLCLRVSANGRKTFTFLYRFAGKQKRINLGEFPGLSLADARQQVKDGKALLRDKVDPYPDSVEGEDAATGRLPDTVSNLLTRYVKDHGKENKERTTREVERLFKLYITPALGDILARAVTSRDVRDMIDDIREDKPVQANRVLSTTRAFFNWAMGREIVASNPTAPIKKIPEKERERVLKDAELKAVWLACDKLEYPAREIVRMLALTGCRRDEVRCMCWSEFDADKGIWTVPGARTKNGLPHPIPLPQMALDILDGVPRFEGGDFVFSTSGGKAAYVNLQKPKATLDTVSEVKDWILHDLRRTAASGMGEIGISGETIARCLNHSERAIAGVTARYNRHDATRAKKEAFALWADHIKALVETKGKVAA